MAGLWVVDQPSMTSGETRGEIAGAFGFDGQTGRCFAARAVFSAARDGFRRGALAERLAGLGGRPAVLVRGLRWSAPEGTAADLVRPPAEDLFR